jgi:uncharacterized membrane protein
MTKQKSRPSKKTSPPDKKPTKSVIAAAKKEHFVGPIPPPSFLHDYDKISPGFADRIISMAEAEAAHQHNIENKSLEIESEMVRREFAERRIGQFCGLLIGLAALGAGTYSAVNGNPISGSILGTGGVIALVTAFIYGKVAESQQENNTGR